MVFGENHFLWCLALGEVGVVVHEHGVVTEGEREVKVWRGCVVRVEKRNLSGPAKRHNFLMQHTGDTFNGL